MFGGGELEHGELGEDRLHFDAVIEKVSHEFSPA